MSDSGRKFTHEDVWKQSEQMIKGRCGYLRQSFPFVIDTYDFSKISLLLDGHNSQVSDIDFYDQTRKAIKQSQLSYDVTLPNYFRRNPFIGFL